jgi:hypothetical protein
LQRNGSLLIRPSIGGRFGRFLALSGQTFLMKTIIFLLFCTQLFTSCMTYQYATITGDGRKARDYAMEIENDTVIISYHFAGHNCPARIRVFNKLDAPIYVDWRRSAFVIYDQTLPVDNATSILNAATTGTEFQWNNNISTSSGDINGSVKGTPAMSFIAPRSYVEGQAVFLKTKPFRLDSVPATWHKETDGMYKLPTAHYSEGNSPMRFRSFVTLALTDDFKAPVYVQNNFWVEKVSKTGIGPKSIGLRQDRFYVTNISSGGGFILGTIVLVLTTAAATAD